MKPYLDYSVSFINEHIIEFLDGFLLGDGNISPSKTKSKTARFKCGLEHEEFCEYLMSFIKIYGSIVSKYNTPNMKQGFVFDGRSSFHPDIYTQYHRWYKNKVKIVPKDVRITPLSVLLWYLGDGSLVNNKSHNSIMLRLSTDAFSKQDVLFLCKRLRDIGIDCSRTSYNRVRISSKGVPAFFNFIGRKSPVKCYDYKFEVDGWRYSTIRMKEAAKLLKMPYNRLAHLVKNNKVPYLRIQDKGRPRFTEEHIKEIGSLII